jgi:hypothetical protein
MRGKEMEGRKNQSLLLKKNKDWSSTIRRGRERKEGDSLHARTQLIKDSAADHRQHFSDPAWTLAVLGQTEQEENEIAELDRVGTREVVERFREVLRGGSGGIKGSEGEEEMTEGEEVR